MNRAHSDFRVCLISPPYDRQRVYSSMSFAAPIEPPLGLAFIAGMLRSKGFEVRLIDSTTSGHGFPELERELRQFRPDLVGVSANSPVYPISNRIATLVKKVSPATTTVLGGCHPTLYPRSVIKQPNVDFVVVGEGEVTLTEICTALAAGRPASGIAGTVHRSGDRVVQEPERPFLKDLDRLPFPAVDLLPLDRYRMSWGIARATPAMSMLASRGCPLSCKFCTSPGIWRRLWRHHSPAYIGELVEMLVRRHGIRHLQFRDDTFTVNRDWVTAICDEFDRRRLRITWDCYSTVGLVEEDLVRRMKRAGCTCLSIGIESGNDEMLRKYKGTTKQEVRDNLALLRRIGMRARLFFMLAPPAETMEHLEQTLQFALELDPEFAMFLPTIPLPGSILYEECLRNNCAPDYDQVVHNFQNVLYAPPPFTIAQLEAFMSRCYRSFYFRPGYLWRMLPTLLSFDSISRSGEALVQLPRLLRRLGLSVTRHVDASPPRQSAV